MAMAAVQGDPSVAVGRARRPLGDVEGLFRKRQEMRLASLEGGGPAESPLVVELLFGMGVKRLGKPSAVVLKVVRLGHGHEEVPPGVADLALDVSLLLAGVRVAEAGREAVARPGPAEEVGLHDHVAPPPPGLGGVVEHDGGGERPRCARSSPWAPGRRRRPSRPRRPRTSRGWGTGRTSAGSASLPCRRRRHNRSRPARSRPAWRPGPIRASPTRPSAPWSESPSCSAAPWSSCH